MTVLDFNSKTTIADRFVSLIDEAIDRAAERPRDYLGASAIGEPCLRKLQYELTGVPKDAGTGFTARIRRIFHRGHKGEEWLAEWIRAAGFTLRTEDRFKRQYGFEDCEGRFKGHVDGVVVAGPNGFNLPALWEAKTLGAKGYNSLVKYGVAKAYPKYAAQVAVYQAYMSLAENPAIFTALNADTMDIHVELVPFNQQLAQENIDKAAKILEATDFGEQLPRAAEASDSFVCKFCPYQGACWG